MKLYISDLHFGHAHAIQFDHRPFADRDEMDQDMIERWNSRVNADDDVYIVGDFCFKCDRSPDWYLSRLRYQSGVLTHLKQKSPTIYTSSFTSTL